MKKRITIISIVLLFVLIAITILYLMKEKEKKEFAGYKVDLTNLNLHIEEKADCIKEKILYHEENGLKYYTSCLNKITDHNGKDLKALLDAKKITFSDIFSTYKKEPITFSDGGSKEYYYDNLNIIKCHTINGNRDVIIGTSLADINEGYCSEDFAKIDKGDCSFTRTYLVKQKKKLDEEKTEVILYQFQGETATVIINRYPAEYLEINQYYEFIFDNIDETIKDQSINDIFENYYFRAYDKTAKKGLDQVQEPVCMPVSRDLIKKAYLFLSKEEQKLIKNYFLAETDYRFEKEITVLDKEKQMRTLNNKEIIIVRFTKEVDFQPNVVAVVIDFKTKEVLGTLLVN